MASQQVSTHSGTAHAKAVLLGEHAVGYGAPAIALPIPALTVRARARRVRRGGRLRSALYQGPLAAAPASVGPALTAVRATLDAVGGAAAGIGPDGVDLRIESHVPPGRGLGSSAAVAAAVVEAVAGACGAALDPQTRHELVQECERVAHGAPSGLDARTVVSSAPLWFSGGSVAELSVGAAGVLVVADTGTAASTLDAVAGVRELRRLRPGTAGAALAALSDLTVAARDDLAVGDLPALGSAMDEAHRLLATLGVSSAGLDHLAEQARRAGALGAKLTGGGRGGCVIALADDDTAAARLAAQLRAAGAHAVWTLGLVPSTAAVAA
ncbi:mevalonate kinase [Xylanimonas sp. McL0601]|uniref:mevalonate kinase n=1 Tax=Xylanimonas sp. McL0601 TaxID=3414739 RepID=UPI003CEF6BFF